MKIVVLDGFAANSHDLSWAPLQQLGELTVYDRSPRETLIERAKDAEAVIINKILLDAEVLTQLPKLRYIGFLSTGYNTVDLEAAKAQGILVANAQGYSSKSVAQHTIAMLLDWCNQFALHAQSVAKGDWSNSPDWTYRRTPLMELHGKTMGIVGLGNIGQQTAAIARALGMKIIAYNPNSRPEGEVEWVGLDELFSRSDVISLHCPLTPDNQGMINRSRIGKMKKEAILINTARGGLIQEEELANALKEGQIAAALMDVLTEEPPSVNNPLIGLKNCRISPHNAWGSVEARSRLIQIVADNLAAFQNGKPQSIVNR
ncbi:MAG: D-2-hydroxyacid dehydrogenase [Bacteroidota bacterium]